MPARSPRPLFGWTFGVRVLMPMVVLPLAVAIGLLGSPPSGSLAVSPDLVIDANEAPPGVLTALPRLGPVLVGRIVEARRAEPLRSLDDLDRRIRGVGPATVEGLRPHLRFGPPSPRE